MYALGIKCNTFLVRIKQWWVDIVENCSALRLNEELFGQLDEELARLDQRRKKSKIDLPMSSVCAGRKFFRFWFSEYCVSAFVRV